jgi:hypothetical protein
MALKQKSRAPRLRNTPLGKLIQFDADIIDSHQADTVVGPSSQGHANEQLSYTQGTTKSAQSIRPGGTFEDIQWQPPITEIEDGNPSNSTTDYSEYAHLLACHEKSHYHQELD